MKNHHLKQANIFFFILILVISQVTPIQAQGSKSPALAGPAIWYVATTGNDSNDCQTPSTPCLTINGAIGKASGGDTILVTGGTYTSVSGTEVVLIQKSITLSGGWDASFAVQTETSIVDGQGARRGIKVTSGTVSIEKFTIQNGFAAAQGGGLFNATNLTLTDTTIQSNTSEGTGGGIYTSSSSTLVVESSRIIENTAGRAGYSGGGGGAGIEIGSGSVTINNSSISKNKLLGGFEGAGINASGILNLENSTVSSNTGGDGTGIYTFTGTVNIDHATITDNQSWGVENVGGHITLQNTIIAENGTNTDCSNNIFYSGTVTSLGYNLIGNGDNCGISSTTGDNIGTTAAPIATKLGALIMPMGYHFLLSDSPAVDSANPSGCPPTDQRGVIRPQGSGCDIGAYEYTGTSGPADAFGILTGTDQSAYLGNPFSTSLAIYVVDSGGNPVNGASVTFTSPASGAGGTFASLTAKVPDQTQSEFARLNIGNISALPIYQTTVNTVDGIARAPAFRANSQAGSYYVTATTAGLSGSVTFSLTNLPINTSPNLLQNGGFEDPVLGNYWNPYSTNIGNPLCTYNICGDGGGTAGPHSGNTWVWFGGIPESYEYGEITQFNVLIPSGPIHLRFYLRIGYAELGSTTNDNLTVSIGNPNSTVVFTADATQQSFYSNYKLVDIDLTPFADDASYHLVRFGSQTFGKIVNFNVDDISISSATFGDVLPGYWSWNWVERLYSAGITGGCGTNPLVYCPASPVTRAQMAVFLLKGIHGSSYAPPAIGATTGFNDVPTSHWAAAWIKQLATESITSGCGDGNYCPETSVTRAQMAVFLLKAMHGSNYTPPVANPTFGDDTGHWAQNWIEELALEGITSGCGNGNYCPDSPVTRDQMAVFLVKAFGLP